MTIKHWQMIMAATVALAMAGPTGSAAVEASGGPQPAGAVKKPPVRITAKNMEVKSDQNLIVFSGEVVAIQDNITINADKITITTAKGGEERRIEEMVAEGNVQLHQAIPEEKIERFATGRMAHYWDSEGKIVLTGDPKAWEKENVITGDVMTFHTRDNLFLVDGKVKVTFYPDEVGVKGPGEKGGGAPSPAPNAPR